MLISFDKRDRNDLYKEFLLTQKTEKGSWCFEYISNLPSKNYEIMLASITGTGDFSVGTILWNIIAPLRCGMT